MKSGFIIFFMLIILPSFGQIPSRTLRWKSITMKGGVENITYGKQQILYFDQAIYPDINTRIPVYYELFKWSNMSTKPEVEFENLEYELVPDCELEGVEGLTTIEDILKYETRIVYIKKQAYLELYLWPLIREDNTIKRLVSFSFRLIPGEEKIAGSTVQNYSNYSLLHTGKWYKIKVRNDGIYKLTYSDLNGLGIENPSHVRVFGMGGGMLLESIGLLQVDDLVEIPSIHYNSSLLFYAQGPHKWVYDGERYMQQLHLYSDYAYYFITDGIGEGKEIEVIPQSTELPTHYVTKFDDYWFYEPEYVNIIRSGKEWFGKPMSNTNENVSVTFTDLDVTTPVNVKINVAARGFLSTNFPVTVNDEYIGTIDVNGLGVTFNRISGTYANTKQLLFSHITTTEKIEFQVAFDEEDNNPSNTEGWLDYINVNVRRHLILSGGSLILRDIQSVGENNIAEFTLQNASENTMVWDITNIHTIGALNTTLQGSQLIFRVATDTIRQFIAFDKNYSFPKPITNGDDVGEVENQNLHGMQIPDFVILTPQNFKQYADTLAKQHEVKDNLNVAVVLLDEVYNEFSSGTPDISAIRNFAKMLYDKDSDTFKYLLLFGDGTYDNKMKNSSNPNFIPTYQSANSINQSETFVSDDFYGILDNGENISNGKLDIGVGRFPVKSDEEAYVMVEKIKIYYDNENMGDWRNIITFIGDDEEGNMHMEDADELATLLNNNYPFINTEKIYLDAYPQIYGSTGASYPDVNIAINNRMKKGALIINYTGHGGEEGLAHEKICSKEDILGWDNPNVFPIFFTATCEFSRFDDVFVDIRGEKYTTSTTAGEMVLLNSQGGGIASFTTNRLVYATDNFILNRNFYNVAFEKDENNQNYRLGDLMRLSKKASSDINKRKFCLLGDPALPILYPSHKVVADSINGMTVSLFTDTLSALGLVNVSGHLEAYEGYVLDTFNGILVTTVYDKPTLKKTLANDGGSSMSFYSQDNILFKGRAAIKNGYFSFSFIIPKDINYLIGDGKISFYAMNDEQDGTGYYNTLTIGGVNPDSFIDSLGPSVNLYMNDSNFIFGGVTDENPSLFAIVLDDNGINTANSGIGHNITAVLDEELQTPIILNDYYQSDLDNYKKGTITYPFSDLSEGLHTLKIKVWDVANNSSVAFTEFIVANSEELAIKHLMNYPNPLQDYTSFYFEHNQNDAELDITLQVFSLSGQLVKTIEYTTIPGGYREGPITWDGRDYNSSKLSGGLYIYRVILRSSDGDVVQKSERLVILR